jgi:cytochrome c-type biogenesis protein CcmE
MKRGGLIIGLIVIGAFGVLGFSALVNSMTPYVHFEEARKAHRTVQVPGMIDKETVRNTPQGLEFDLYDEKGDRLHVIYQGPKPGNFDQAKGVVAIGRFRDGSFHARRLLVKCPSKYQGGYDHPSSSP